MGDLNEIHDLPLANRLVDGVIREWLNQKFGLQFAQYGGGSPERKALEQARYVGLDGYTYNLTPVILDALRRAGLLASGLGIQKESEG